MRRVRTAQDAPSASRRRRGLLPALIAFACACAFVVQSPGWAQTSYMALSRGLLDGTPQIDKWHWETHDVAYNDGHYYSVKPPGLSIVTLPLYAGLREAGGEGVARDARIRAESGGNPWGARTLPTESYGYSRKRAIAARALIADDAPMTWALGLLGMIVPALILLVVVRRMVERVSPGTGTAAALTLGACTMILPFSTLYFSHVISALLAFGAFALLWRERAREGGRAGGPARRACGRLRVPAADRGRGAPSRSRHTSANAPNASSALITCEKYSVEKGRIIVQAPSVRAAAVPVPGDTRSTMRRTTTSRISAGTIMPSRPSAHAIGASSAIAARAAIARLRL